MLNVIQFLWYSIDLWSVGGGGALVYVHSVISGTLFGVVVYYRSMVDWRRVHVPYVYVHSAICSNLFGVAIFHTSMVNCKWVHLPYSICAFCYMLNVFGVLVFHTSMVNCRRGYMCLSYMCILLYVQLIWCSGMTIHLWSISSRVHLAYVYVHSAKC